MDSQQINNNQKEPQESPANTIKIKSFTALVRRSWSNHESWLHTIEFFTFYFTKYFLCYFRLYLSYSILLCPIEKYIRFSLWRKKEKKKRNETYAYNGEKNYPIGNLLTLFFFLVEFLRCVLRSNESNESDFSGNLVLFSFVIRLHTAHCVSKANNFCINFCALFYSSFCHFVFKYLQYTLFFCLISCVNFQTYFLYFNFIRINREKNIFHSKLVLYQFRPHKFIFVFCCDIYPIYRIFSIK